MGGEGGCDEKLNFSGMLYLCTVPVNKKFMFDDRWTIVQRCEHWRSHTVSVPICFSLRDINTCMRDQ